MRFKIVMIGLVISLFSCSSPKEEAVEFDRKGFEKVTLDHADNFSLERKGNEWLIHVNKPYQQAEQGFTYLITDKRVKIKPQDSIDEVVRKPVDSLICTSTTHIPSLKNLSVLNRLVGFPGTDMISTPEARKRVNSKEIMELGNNGQLNTERVISLQPDVVVGFAVSSTNATLDKISSFGIPVVYNSDWLEKHPLGKAEWVKFFGALTGKFEASVEFYNEIREEYDRLKELAQKADEPPKVIAGAMLNEQWYLPYGNSWQARFIKDANADYIYGYTEGKGSIALSFEKVFKKSRDADVWVAPAQYTAYDKMKEDNRHYARFKAFKERNIHGFASTKGETGGVLFYEQAPNRPELVLKDLIHIFHPELLEDHENQFFKPLE